MACRSSSARAAFPAPRDGVRVERPEVELVGRHVGGRRVGDPLGLGRREPGLERRRDLVGDVVLHREQIGELPVVLLGPERLAGPHVWSAPRRCGPGRRPGARCHPPRCPRPARATSARAGRPRCRTAPWRRGSAPASAATRESWVAISSVIPALKYCCAVSAGEVAERKDGDDRGDVGRPRSRRACRRCRRRRRTPPARREAPPR